MKVEKAMINIDDLVSAELTCLEQHLDSKAEVKKRILEAFHQFTSQAHEEPTAPTELGEIPVPIFNLLQNELGIGFDVNNGKITGFSIETARLTPLAKGKLESAYAIDERGSEQSTTSIKN